VKREFPPTWLAATAFPAVALALYGGALQYPLVFDDLLLVRDTALSASGTGPRALSHASFRWIQALAGGEVSWQRLANVLLHGAVGAVLFGFLARLFEAVLGPRMRWTAFLGALAFVLHPAAVYGVAYLGQRSIVMATLFSVLSLWCVLEGLLRRSSAWFVAGALSYGLAVVSKEHAVMLPAVAGALAVLLRGISPAMLRKAGLALLLTGVVAAGIVYQRRALLGAAYEPFVGDVAGASSATTLALSMLNQAFLYFRYLLTWLLPCPCWMSIDLRVDFPGDLLSWPQTVGAIAYLAYPLAAASLLLRGGRLGLLGFGLLYAWLLSLTELAAVRVQEPFVLYRSYLWMGGLAATLPALAPGLAPRTRNAILAAICIALVPLAVNRLATFSSPLALWDDAVRKNRDSGAAYRERALINRGELLRGAGQRQAALADFDLAIAANPRLAEGYASRATLYLELGRLQEALADLDRAVALDPRHGSAHAKRCYAKFALGLPRADALADCEQALRLEPGDPEIRAIDDRVRRR
jgi:tetratricopeptide (TPR) repeat protein